MDFTTAAHEAFAQSILPKDAYDIAMNHMPAEIPESVLHANGLHVSMQFPPYFKSYAAMETACATSFQHLTRDIPRLRLMASQKGLPPPVIAGAMESRIARYGTANVEWIQMVEAERISASHLGVQDLTTGILYRTGVPTTVRLSELMVDNLSQFHRTAQLRFQVRALALLRQAAIRLSEWCAPREFAWSLRPLLAMSGNQEETLLFTGPTRGIQNPELYMNSSNLQALEFFKSQALDTVIFEQFDNPLSLAENYKWWMDSAITAAIFMGDGECIAFTPLGLPPHLVRPVRDTIPLYMSNVIPQSCVKDQVAVIAQMTQTEFENPEWIAARYHRAMEPGIRHAAQLLAVTAALATFVLAPLQWGRGFKKPAWMQSPPNSSLVNHLLITADYLISRVNP